MIAGNYNIITVTLILEKTNLNSYLERLYNIGFGAKS